MGGVIALAGLTLTSLSTTTALQSHISPVAFADTGGLLGRRVVAEPETGVVSETTPTASLLAARRRALTTPHRPSPSATAAATPVHSGPPAREVLGFAPQWTLNTWREWRMQDLSTIAYFAVTVDENGNTVTDDVWQGWQSQDLTDMVNAAHRAHVKVLVTLRQFDQDSIESMLSDGNHAATAVQTAVDLVKMRGLDGVVIDFEGTADPNDPGLQTQFRWYVQRVRARLTAYRADTELVVATFAGSAQGDGGMYDIHGLSPFVDGFFVMAYDMAGANTPGQASATAPLQGGQFNDTDVVAQYLSRTTADKLILGVPYYGYKWSVTSPDPNAATVSDPQAATYAQLYTDFSCAQSLSVHSGGATPWATWYSPPGGDPCGANIGAWREAYFDTAATLGAKYDLVNRRNLRGTGMWALGFDTGHTELWDVLQSHVTAAHRS
jgi:spore germination protein YaaH